MTFLLVDGFTYVLYGLKWLIYLLAWLMLLLGLDDLVIDVTYWVRLVRRRFGVYRRQKRADEDLLFQAPEQPLAIMVPAWHEVGVVGLMARLAASTLDYENYQIFVGTYPNDPETQADVDDVCLHFPNVHKVVCARPGPTSKADCLNNVIDAILRFEANARVQFAGFILHDAEDVVSPMELRLFNYLLPRKDLIQVPVYPYAPEWNHFTAGHYVDEFAEYHGKDVVVREALIGQVPSAGVGTCFSRRAITVLLEQGDGIAFDVQSLTEDYDIGFRLKRQGMAGIFARFHVRDPDLASLSEHRFGVSAYSSRVICVREHFPRSLQHAIRQKSRWITGIVFQGTRTLGWSRDWRLNYFLWRDRRGAIANLLGLLVNLLFVVLLGLWLTGLFWPTAWHFPPLLEDDPLLRALLIANGVLLANRLFQRFYFVTLFYGLGQGLLSAPRMMWSNLVNFLANLRALRQVIQMGDSRRVAWDKTTHEFPALADPRRTPIGLRLVELGALDQETLDEVIIAPRQRRLGRELLLRGLIDSHQLAQVLAEQADLDWAPLDPFELDPRLIETFPLRLALRYSVLPVAQEGATLVLASERATSEVSLGAIARQLKRPVRCRLAPQGRVTLGLRHWYGGTNLSEQAQMVLHTLASRHRDGGLMEKVCRHQVLLGDLIQERGLLPAPLLGQALIDFDPTRDSLGEHLIERGLISRETLEEALREQQAEQRAAYDLLRAA
tara:strand:- start:4393 stop:6564 length:2172 start_codon:yes stop_codon:yes gene_type:complete